MSRPEVVALVPVREGSRRVKEKNFRPFADEKSLLHLKLEQLQRAGCFDHIYVSSDSDRARAIASEAGVEFVERPSRLCRAGVPWFEVTDYILESIPGDPLAAWTMVTAPLYEDYATAVREYLEAGDEYNSLATVLESREYLLDEDGTGINCDFGFWHSYTDELPVHYVLTGSLYLARKSDQLRWHYWIGTRPLLYPISKLEAVDVDTEEDFRLAEAIYLYRKEEGRGKDG